MVLELWKDFEQGLRSILSEWKKAKKLAIKFSKARIPLTEAEKRRLAYLEKKHNESK